MVEKIPFFALALVSSVLTILAQKSGGAIASAEAVPLSSRLPVAVQSIVLYIWKMLWPRNLIPLYPYPQNVTLFSFEYLIPMFLAAGITLACITVARKDKLWLSAWLYYLITLIPVIGIIQVGGQAMADRYAYLPSIGPFLVAGIMTYWIYNRAASRQLGFLSKAVGIPAVAFVLVFMPYATVKQIGIWKNGQTLWSYVIEKEPLNVPRAYNNLGYIFLREGHIESAISIFRTAIDQDPAYAHARNNLCIAYKSIGLYEEAVEQCRAAIGLKPDYAEAYNNLGVSYKYLGLPDEAIEQYMKALSLNPDYAEAFFNLGIAYLDKGDRGKARSAFISGLKIKPDDAKARQVLDSIN
jgi:tetratricopeptide (TPR) repeat protein